MQLYFIAWLSIFVSDEGLTSEVYKEFIQINSKDPNNSKYGQRTWADIFPKKTHKFPAGV